MLEAKRVTAAVRFGPADHGRRVTEDEFDSAEYEPGFQYEVVDGRLYVSPQANFGQHWLERWLLRKFDVYSEARPDVVNFIATKGRLFIPGRPELTNVEPDISLYEGVPLDRAPDEIDWRELSPFLVTEVLTGHPDKDLVRNVELFWLVPTIKEYWVLDGRERANRPSLIVHRRRGKRWVVRTHPFDSTYTTRLLPGFRLRINPRR